MGNPGIVLLGAVIASDRSNVNDALAFLEGKDCVKISVSGNVLNIAVQALLDALAKNSITVLLLNGDLPQEFFNILRSISENRIDLALAGTDERLIKCPVTESGKALILAEAAVFDAMKNQDLFTPVCRI